MDNSYFCDLLAKFGLSHRTLANMIGYKASAIRNWMRGFEPIPSDVADWLRRLDHFMDYNPPPRKD